MCCSCLSSFRFFFPERVMLALGLDLQGTENPRVRPTITLAALWRVSSLSLCLKTETQSTLVTDFLFFRWWTVMRPWSTTAPTIWRFFFFSRPRTRRLLKSFLPNSCKNTTTRAQIKTDLTLTAAPLVITQTVIDFISTASESLFAQRIKLMSNKHPSMLL